MRTIQDVGTEILSSNPANFYIFLGSEYGIKSKYIEKLKEVYQGRYFSYDSVKSVLDMMRSKHLIPLQPSLYVVRYDESFVSSVNANTEKFIQSTKISGTIICIYENSKHAQKLSKYLDNFCVTIDKVSDKFIAKYLKADFPEASDRLINLSILCGSDYFQSRNVCGALCNEDIQKLSKLPDSDIVRIFGYENLSTESMLKVGIASRNFGYCLQVLNNYNDIDTAFYTILQTMIDLDKLKSSKYSDSEIFKYIKMWDNHDIYMMFHNTYNVLKQSRSISYDIDLGLISLLFLITLKPIPSLEVI